MTKRAICHLTHTDVRKDSRILKELTALSDELDHIKIYAIGIKSNHGPKDFNIPEKINVFSLQEISRRIKPRFLRHIIVFSVLTFFSLIKLIKIRPSVVHCHDTMVLPIGGIYSIFSGCRLVYDAHELESQKNGLTKILAAVTVIFEKLFWWRVSLFITVSPSIENYYIERYGRKNSLLILNSPKIVTNSNSLKIPDVRAAFKFAESDKIYLYIGIFGKGRGIEQALIAFEQVKKTNKVVFVGWGVLEDQIRKSKGFGENIFLHPAIHHELLPEFASTADFGLCLLEPVSKSDYFALPNKLFEYAFAGVPILGSNFPDISDIVQRYSLGVCFEPTIEGLINAVQKAENIPFQLDQVNIEDLSWKTQEDRLISAYKKLLGNI